MRLALLTGGSRGLGQALCQQLQAEGYALLEFSRGAPHDYSVAADLAQPKAWCAVLNTALDAQVGQNLHAISELLVFNNAASLQPIGPAARQSPAQLLENININFSAAIVFLSQVVARFRALDCRKLLVNISSGAAQQAYAGWSLYCAAKAGLERFVEALALEQQLEAAPFGAINISPGVIDTDMQTSIRASHSADFPQVQRFIERKRAGDLPSAAAVAAAVLHIVRLPHLRPGARYAAVDYLHASPANHSTGQRA